MKEKRPHQKKASKESRNINENIRHSQCIGTNKAKKKEDDRQCDGNERDITKANSTEEKAASNRRNKQKKAFPTYLPNMCSGRVLLSENPIYNLVLRRTVYPS